MSKIIIKNMSSKPDADMLLLVSNVIREGRVSDEGKCYCYITHFTGIGVAISANVTKTGTDSFIVWDKTK